MVHLWIILCVNSGGNRLRDTVFLAKKLKCQTEVRAALAHKLIAEEQKFQI